jgi:hypothetical protein
LYGVVIKCRDNDKEEIMSLKKMKKCSGMQLAALLVFAAFTLVMGACPDDGGGITTTIRDPDDGGNQTDDGEEILADILPDPINYSTELSWGTEFTPTTLGLTPGNNTTELMLNWYSAGGTIGSKVAEVRFIEGTKNIGYALREGTGVVAAAGGTNFSHKVKVTGLKPGASYQYSVSTDGNNWSPMYDFKVPPATGAWKFAVIADPQLTTGNIDANSRNVGTTTAAGWVDTMSKIVAAGVSFIASGGDQVDATGGNETEYTNLFAPAGLRNLPLAPVHGNHDTHLHFTYHYNVPNQQTVPGATYTTSGGGTLDQIRGEMGNYFYLYNNILFVALSTAPYPNTVANAAPYITIFRQTLTAAKAAHPNYDWLIVQHHKSTASVAEHLADADIEIYVKAGFETLMSEMGVDFVLAGHDHVYARSYPLKGMDDGKVSIPDTTKGGHELTGVHDPIYLTFTTGSGLKYYEVAGDPYFAGTGKTYATSTTYPYLGTDALGNPTKAGTTEYKTGILPVSNAAFVQPYIPSYAIVEVSNSTMGAKTIKFSTYANTSVQNGNASAPNYRESSTLPSFTQEKWEFNEATPYDWVQVTK